MNRRIAWKVLKSSSMMKSKLRYTRKQCLRAARSVGAMVITPAGRSFTMGQARPGWVIAYDPYDPRFDTPEHREAVAKWWDQFKQEGTQ